MRLDELIGAYCLDRDSWTYWLKPKHNMTDESVVDVQFLCFAGKISNLLMLTKAANCNFNLIMDSKNPV